MKNKKHVFVIGAKNIGQYGGFETFVDNLITQHKDNPDIQYHVAVKANGYGSILEESLDDIEVIDNKSFKYHNAIIDKIIVPEIGNAQAIIYDVRALRFYLDYCKKNNMKSPIFYILACRIGPFIKTYYKQIHQLGGTLFVNPDGQEWKRDKWNKTVKLYWKYSEKQMITNCDCVICDSLAIEEYIHNEYNNVNTIYLSYGSDYESSTLSDDDKLFTDWLNSNEVKPYSFYMYCGRFVPENNFDVMIREFMKSCTDKDFVIITTYNQKYYKELDHKYNFKSDKRIKFVSPVYNHQLLKKIREVSYAYIHGHSVGGTNPSLLEALASTDINLINDVEFNREVGGDAVLYFDSSEGSLSSLINRVDKINESERKKLGSKAKHIISQRYSWDSVGVKYEQLWLNDNHNYRQ